MNEGVLQQVGAPSEVYLRPANLFVAQFVGSPVMNVLPVEVTAEADRTAVALDGHRFDFARELHARLEATLPAGHDLVLGVRPEGVQLAREAAEGARPMEAHLIEPLGAYDIVDLKLGERFLKARTASGFVRAPGDTVWARLDPAQVHFFDATTGASLHAGPGDG
jgi:multiple sugar transport system ATP-binding protein